MNSPQTSPSPSPTHLLRIEGVNLDRFVLDTRDLSTIRGGGLLLLDAAKNRAKQELGKVASPNSVVEISVGASIGLFGFVPASGKTAELARDAVAAELRKDDKLKYATFVVDVEMAPTDPNKFRDASESVLAKNRWRQYQAGALSIPLNEQPHDRAKPVCELDGVSPKLATLSAAEKDQKQKKVSISVLHRRRFGQNQKQTFYETWSKVDGAILDWKGKPPFANEFEEIAASNGGASSHLANKLAFFYADGNSFSKIMRGHCKTEPQQKAWDEFIRSNRSKWLHDFLKNELFMTDGWIGPSKSGGSCFRFETLMWGGDEVMFVMPAWKGLAFAEHFFQSVEKWNLNQATIETDGNRVSAGFPSTPLTQTAALIFCHHHAPIQRIKKLAKDRMAEFAKKQSRAHNQLVYQVLESYDHLGGDYTTATKQRLKKCCEPEELILSSLPPDPKKKHLLLSEKLTRLRTQLPALKGTEFPRSQLRATVLELIHGAQPLTNERHEHLMARLSKRDPKIRDLLKQLRPCFASHGAFWFHLEELWDYAL